MLTHPITARAMHVLDFEFGDPVRISFSNPTAVETAPACAVIGLQTAQLHQLLIKGKIEGFSVFFRPAALYLLFGLPVTELTNRHYEAHCVIGSAISELHQQLGNATHFRERVDLADHFFQKIEKPGFSIMEQATNEIMRHRGGYRIADLARHVGLGIRQFERLFLQSIGVSPKLYARIVRFESALEAKAFRPHTSWTAIAHQFRYHDQMHMIHDFQQLSGETPTGILAKGESIFSSPTIAVDGPNYTRFIL
jgi:AraC-like DNA-binding protein